MRRETDKVLAVKKQKRSKMRGDEKAGASQRGVISDMARRGGYCVFLLKSAHNRNPEASDVRS